MLLLSKKSPPSALFQRKGETTICSLCLSRGHWFLSQNSELQTRQSTWQFLDDVSPASMVERHFDGIEPSRIVTSSRRFAEYLRVDLNRTLEKLLGGPESRAIGLHQQYGHATITYAGVLNKVDRISIAPLQYDEVDIGESEPARCLRHALWLVPGDGTPHVVLLSQDKNYGDSHGWHVEIAVPPGEKGDAICRKYFRALEEALNDIASYRGKVLSLEKSDRTSGTGALVDVHRISAVRREDVILPDKTSQLLERNVFSFTRHRKELAAMGLPLKKGLLFYGPPGTGKTHTIREEVLLNRLLNEMDGLKENSEILFVLTTNRPESLELALTARPGRIDQAIEFPLPDGEGRRKLARLYGRGLVLSEEVMAHVVERTQRVSAAFIKELMRRSAQFALERDASKPALTAADVEAALDELLFSGGRLNAALLGALGAHAEAKS